ncbi:hypothetical protein BCEP4_750011 [Burkholderia cepacia]|nr:hypothetical protein BCEP4_750011 [Burkholderia cepacia]
MVRCAARRRVISGRRSAFQEGIHNLHQCRPVRFDATIAAIYPQTNDTGQPWTFDASRSSAPA